MLGREFGTQPAAALPPVPIRRVHGGILVIFPGHFLGGKQCLHDGILNLCSLARVQVLRHPKHREQWPRFHAARWLFGLLRLCTKLL